MQDRRRPILNPHVLRAIVKADPFRVCLSLFEELSNGRRLALLGLAVLVISSMLTPLLTSGSAWADPNASASCAASGGTYSLVNGNGVCTPGPTIADGFTPAQEATSYSYYVALGGCIQNNMEGTFQTTINGNGNSPPSEWFDDNQAFGYVYPGGTKTDCKDIAAEALTLWGWTGSTQTFLKAMNYSFAANTTTGQPTYTGTGDGAARITDFQTAVKSQVYDGSSPSLDAPATYDIDLDSFTLNGGSCNANDLGPYDQLGTDVKKYVDAGTQGSGGGGGRTKIPVVYVKVPVVDSTTGISIDHGYTYSYTVSAGVGTSTTTDLVTLYGYHATAKTATCEDLVAGIKKNAVAYSIAVQASKKGDTQPPNFCQNHPTDPSCKPAASTCNIPQLGWILCPVLTTGANLADSAYGFLADNFLSTDPSLVGTDPNATVTNPDGSTSKVGDGTFVAWGIMRNIANVAFIIVFLIIIFSQISNVGVTNFGVKKLLPRLIIGAVLTCPDFPGRFLCVDHAARRAAV